MCKEARVHGTQWKSPAEHLWKTAENQTSTSLGVLVDLRTCANTCQFMQMAVLDFPRRAIHLCGKSCAQPTKSSKLTMCINYVLTYLQIVHDKFETARILWGSMKW